jgi:hypothetical protein
MEWRLIFMTDHELQLKAVALRRAMLRLIANVGAGHTGGDSGRSVRELFWVGGLQT